MRIRLAVIVFFCFFLSLQLSAQKFTGTIRGLVTDTSGAVVAGAEVSIKNDATGETRNVTTNQSGEYVAPELDPANYTITVKHPNFKESVTKGVVLNVSSITTINAQLAVGNVNEQVTVEAGAVQVETATGAVGNVIEGNEVQQLPLNGRSFAQLTQLMPGVSSAANYDAKNKGLQSGVDFSVNGNNTTGNLTIIDGVNDNDVGSNRTVLVFPSIDAIQEFKILRNSYGPEYGQAMGAIITILTRSGSNSFHGGAFYDGRNDVLDATDWINGLNHLKKDKLRRNDWGYTIGGPIFRDKLFFFFSEEWNHEQRGAARSGDVPTALEKAGDFSVGRPGQVDNSGNTCDPIPVVKDSNGVVTAGPFTNISQVPGGGISPGGQAYLSMFPDPNVANPIGCKNWAASLAAPIRWREESARIDWHPTSTWSVMGRYTQDHWAQPYPSTLGFWGDDPYPSIESNWQQPGYQATVKITKLFGSTAVNDFQIAYGANKINVTRGGTNPTLNDTINKLAPTFYPFSGKFEGTKIGYPGFWGGCGVDCATGDNLWTQAPWHNNENLYVLKDDFSKVFKNHTFKVGFLVSNNQKNEMVNNESQENAFYWGATTNNTGNGAFNMLWDQVKWGGSEAQTNPYSQIRWHDFEPYFGDTWKVRRNLTLEYGFRWSFLREPYSNVNKIANFVPSLYNPALAGDPCNGLVLPPGTNWCAAAGFSPGIHGSNRALKAQNNHAIAPRIGLAWDPRGNGKTAIRAGLGQFFQRERLNNTLQMATNPPFSLSAGFERTFDTPPPTLTASGTPGFSQDPGDKLPNTWQWNLTFEQEVFRDSKLELAYVGNRGIHLLNYTDANRVPLSLRSTFAITNDNNLRPFGNGNWGTINQAFWGGGSNYHALQALFRTRVKALDAQFAYTWSRSLTDTDLTNSGNVNQTSLLVDPARPHLNYGPSLINRPHIFTGSIVYNAPGLRQQNMLVRSALGGWQISSILNYASGASITTYGSRTANGAKGGINGIGGSQDNLRPNLVPGQPCRATTGPKNQWLNPNRYTLVGYVVGTPTGTAGVGDCLGPPLAQTDLGVYKNFKAGERVTLQFRMDAFNVFNHVQFQSNAQGYTQLGNVLDTTSTVCGNVVCSYTPSSSYGVSQRTRGPRELQYGLKLTF
jgi:hypothetical protein